jgi:thioredoxin reductase
VNAVPVERELDAVVVGGGPSGLAAASWLARYRRRVVVVDSGEHRADRVEHSHGYLGRDPQTPRELLARGREELLAYPSASIVADVVESARRRADGAFDVELRTAAPLIAHKLVLACGVVDAKPDVPGLEEHYGASVFHCPACDGYEARDQDVVALGWSENLSGFAATLLGWARSVTVVTAGERFRGDDAYRTVLDRYDIEVIEERVVELVGKRGALRAARLESGRVLPCSLAFFSVEHQPRVELARRLGCDIDDDGYVAVNDCGMTSVDGVYAAGDLVPGLQLTSIAVAKGVVAGVGCAQSFFGRRTAALAAASSPDVPRERAELRG